jgi:flagellar motor switch protein FliN
MALDGYMSELTPQIAEQVRAACQANAGEVGGALSRTLDSEITVAVGKSDTLGAGAVPTGPGLVVLFTFGEAGFVAVLGETSGLLPDWYRAPDKTGQSKLSTLGQELSMLLVPDSLAADEFKAVRVGDIAAALERAEAAEGAATIALELMSGDKKATLQLIWPVPKPGQLFDEAKEQTGAPGAAPPAGSAPVAEATSRGRTVGSQMRGGQVAELPGYSRSLLKINVPVSVVLATKKESVHDVVELAPGTIIKFSKSCEESLNLYVGDQKVAEGEAVKVGDKFGFRVTVMTLPDEHFLKVRPGKVG